MVGIVLVSHSRPLAQAVLDLVRQMIPPDVPFALAAGIGDQRELFGTDAIEIMEAIQAVSSPDGVLVLMDLGSAILSAEMAVELLPDDERGLVKFCAAPLVEGAIAAGVQAGLGSDLDTVFREAQSALFPKQEHLGQGPALQAAVESPGDQAGDTLEARLVIKNLHGLHARPAARFVQTSAKYNADIRIQDLTNQKGPVSAKSLNAVATLGAVKGHQVVIQARGPDAQQALAALTEMVESAFGEETQAEESEPAAPRVSDTRSLISISEGAALGPLYRYRPNVPEIPLHPAQEPLAEWDALLHAIEQSRLAIQQRRQSLTGALGNAQAEIFDAHLLILQDPDLLAHTKSAILDGRMNAAAAWDREIHKVAETYRAIPDKYLQQRAVDVLDVGNQVLVALLVGNVEQKIELPEPVILFAQELTPTETAQLDMTQVLGVVTVLGGPTSHSAILARALGIPAVTGVDPVVEGMPDGTLMAVDGFEGRVWINPTEDIQALVLAKRTEWLEQRERLLQTAQLKATTLDGRRIEIAANIGSTQDARAAIENGAEGVGLLRTEFLFLTRTTAPSEAEQVDALRPIAEVMGNRPVIVRTLDVGGDKELPYIQLPKEANPFLGVRALRLSLKNPELFLTQLRSILRAGNGANFRIMYPMVANLSEVLQAREYLEQARDSLVKEGIPHAWPIEAGIMVEIPAAALLSEVLAQQVDFFSIGTNDLAQYTLAAERGNPNLPGMADALHPAVLRLIHEVAGASHHYGKWTGVCGELAGDPLAIPILVGLGVDELSMNPGAISRAKAILRLLDSSVARSLAEETLEAPSVSEARAIANRFYQQNIQPYL